MKFWKLAVPGVVAMLAAAAQGTLLMEETFSYADGNITDVSSGAWTAHSGIGNNPVQVASGAAALQHGSGSREDVNRQFGTVTNGSVYAAFELSVSAAAPIGGGDYEYFAHFGAGTSTFVSRMDVVNPSGSGDFSVGISTTSGSAETTWGSDLTFGQTYQVVLQYDHDLDQARVWIDPVNMGSTSMESIAQGSADDVTGFYLRQSTSTSGELVTVDNLRIATTFGEAIPEPSTLALLGLGGLLACLRRRR